MTGDDNDTSSGSPEVRGDSESHWEDAWKYATNAVGAVYRAVWDRPDEQRAVLGVLVFLLGVLASDQIETAFDFILGLIPFSLFPNATTPFFASNRLIVVLLTITLIHQVRKLNHIEQEAQRMSGTRADGGSPRDPRHTDHGPFDPPEGDGDASDPGVGDGDDNSPGVGAVGGAIAGAALGSAYGPGGTIGGAVLGAVLGDSIVNQSERDHSP